MRNGWLNTYFPIRVVPVSSISTAARRVGYVGRINKELTAANDATAITGLTPTANAAGMRAFVVAAWEYNKAAARNNTRASIHG